MVPLFDALITSKMRVRILMRLFLNAGNQAYLRELASEFDASPGHVNKELQQLAAAGLLDTEQQGRQINYRANTTHPLFPELQSMVRKALGMDQVLDSIIHRLGDLEEAYLVGDYARGEDSGRIELVLVGDINRTNLRDLQTKTERHIGRKIDARVFGSDEFKELADSQDKYRLLLFRRGDSENIHQDKSGRGAV
jgi:DNA-binding transcriptional ArsR family regulator